MIIGEKNKRQKKETANKTLIRKFNLQQRRYKAFQKCKDSINSLSASPTKESMFSNFFNLYSTIIKDTFGHIGGRIGVLPNQRRETVSRKMINLLLKNLNRYHHHHHVTLLLWHHATPLFPIDQ